MNTPKFKTQNLAPMDESGLENWVRTLDDDLANSDKDQNRLG